MFCSRCGQAMAEGAYFCPKCGAQNAPSGRPLAASPTAVAQPTQTSGMAIASLVCSLIPFFLVTPVLAVILGHMALSEIKRSAGRLKGSGLAIAGLVLGYCSFIPVILIIAAIAIPNLLRAKIVANESSAVASVRILNTAERNYAEAHPERGYTCSFADLQGSISPELASGNRNGYIFELVECKPENDGGPNTQYEVIAYPINKNRTGRKAYCSNQTALVRYHSSGSGEDCLENGSELR